MIIMSFRANALLSLPYKKSKQKNEVVTTPGVEKVKQGCEVDDQTEEKVNHSGAGTDQEPGHLCQYRQNKA